MEGLYNLLKSVADNLDFDVEFQQGRASDINPFAENNKSVMLWYTFPKVTGQFINNSNRLLRTFSVEIGFYMQDQRDSTNEDTRQIIETVDKIILNYILDLNTQIMDLDDATIDIEPVNVSQESFVKITAHVLSGQLVTFNIVLPDDFNYCV